MFTVFDLIILTILFISSITGLYRGAIYIVITFLGFIISIFVAAFLYSYLRTIFSIYIANYYITSLLSGIISYILSQVIFSFLLSNIVSAIREFSYGTFDKSLGLVFGLARGIMMSLVVFSVTILFIMATHVGIKKFEDFNESNYPPWLRDSATTPFLEITLSKLVHHIPGDLLKFLKMSKVYKYVNDMVR